jgi:general stress protein 26
MGSREHTQRINAELKAAGMSNYGLIKLDTSYLPKIIHKNEHIKGVVYGRIDKTIDAGMLVATDMRVIFLDCKPFYKNWDEITYEVVAGVKTTFIGPFAGVVLHTRVKDYTLRFVNIKCAKIFDKYIEGYIESKDISKTTVIPEIEPIAEKEKDTNYQPYLIDHKPTIDSLKELNKFERMDDTAVLSTIDKDGNPHASVVHFEVDKDENFYILTKEKTQKAINISRNRNVALTIHNSGSLKVMYIKGFAEKITDKETIEAVKNQIASFREYQEGTKLAPITKISAGDYTVFKITPTSTNLQDFGRSSW